MKVKLRRNRHALTNYQCGTCFAGEVVPVGYAEVLPGDTFNHHISGLVRFAAMNAPIMHRVHAEYFTFYQPWRIVWPQFEDFITRTPEAALPPVLTLGNIKADAGCRRLCEYLGLNTDSVVAGSDTEVNILRLWAYNNLWNEWFRDKDLMTPVDTNSTLASEFEVLRACWRKDNYTLARPEPQYGADVTIPLGTTAPVVFDNARAHVQSVYDADDDSLIGSTRMSGTNNLEVTATNTGPVYLGFDPSAQLSAETDLSAALAPSVVSLRRAFNLQALAERLQNFGHDYRSMLASMGVQSDDGRLQLPELLASGKVPLSFSEVLQTAEGTTTGVGDMYGHGIAAARNHPYRRFFKEHGCIITVMVVRPQAIYNNTVDRDWFHGLVDGANDYYTPELERIGFQEFYNKEIYPTNAAGGDGNVWAYGPRYGEYRGIQSRVAGLFKVGASLDYWTWARGWDSLPALNDDFVRCEPDPRIFQETTQQHILYAVNHTLIAQRMLTKNITGRII